MKKEPVIVKIFVENLQMVARCKRMTVADLHSLSGVSVRHINYLINGDRVPGIDVVEKLANALGVKPYLMLLPGLEEDMLATDGLDLMYQAYRLASSGGRQVLDSAAQYIVDTKPEE